MVMEYAYKEIGTAEIFDSHTYTIHPFLKDSPSPKSLMESIDLSGLINPPGVIELEDMRYDVIYGRQRLKCICSQEKIWCKIFPPSTSPETILSVIMEDQHSKKNLNLIEQAFFLKLCQTLIPNNEKRHSYLQKLSQHRITKGHKFLDKFLDLHPKIQRKLHEGVVSEKAVNGFLKFDHKQQCTLVNLFKNLQLSSNNQKNVITDLYEISRRKGITLDNLLESKDFTVILHNHKMLPKQRSIKFLQLLKQLNNPRLSAAQKELESEIKQLKLPANINLTPSQYFETEEVTLSIKFKNFNECKSVWKGIADRISTTQT